MFLSLILKNFFLFCVLFFAAIRVDSIFLFSKIFNKGKFLYLPLSKYLLSEELKFLFSGFNTNFKDILFYNCNRSFESLLFSFETEKMSENSENNINYLCIRKNPYGLFVNSESFLANGLFFSVPLKFFVKVKKTTFSSPVLKVNFSFVS